MTGRRTPAAGTLASRSRLELVNLLRTRGSATIAELAASTGLHENTTREHLQRLVADGYVVRAPEHRTVRGRPRMVYRAVDPDPVSDDGTTEPADTPVARNALVAVLLRGYGRAVRSPAGAALAAGRGFGRRQLAFPRDLPAAPSSADHRQLEALAEHLDAMGFRPTLEDDPFAFHLWRCPFADLARERPEVVCNVHLGLAEGVLESVGGPVRCSRLRPFVTRGHCVLELERAADPRAAGDPVTVVV